MAFIDRLHQSSESLVLAHQVRQPLSTCRRMCKITANGAPGCLALRTPTSRPKPLDGGLGDAHSLWNIPEVHVHRLRDVPLAEQAGDVSGRLLLGHHAARKPPNDVMQLFRYESRSFHRQRSHLQCCPSAADATPCAVETFFALLIFCQVLEAMKLLLRHCGNLKAQLRTTRLLRKSSTRPPERENSADPKSLRKHG